MEAIRVGGILYEVRAVPGLADGNQALDGHIEYRPCRISINDNLCAQTKFVTLWHEALHAILTQAGQEQLSEMVMDALVYGIVQVLRDNPEMTKEGG